MTQIPDIVPARELALESALRSAISFLNPDSLDEIEHFVLGLAHAALALPPDSVNADMLAALRAVASCQGFEPDEPYGRLVNAAIAKATP